MKWRRIGLVQPPAGLKWLRSHAQNPFPQHVGGHDYKIHISGRNADNQAHGAWVRINFRNPLQVLDYSRQPTIGPGELGAFDDSGVMPSCIVERDDAHYMYYTGWSRAVSTPFSFFIGLALSRDGGRTFQRVSRAPVLGRTLHDPFLTAAPWVLVENDRWRMWYTSCERWLEHAGAPTFRYHIRYAESTDGTRWRSEGTVCIDFLGQEYAIGRPIVSKQRDTYTMWYCHRGGTGAYRLGYAESKDGLVWERKDETVGLDVLPGSDWEAEMLCYACPLEHQGVQYLLYNGDGYGRAGFGVAIRDDQ